MPSYLQWAVVLSLAAQCTAQTYTSCNPMKKTCPADTGLSTYTLSTDFTSGDSAFKRWNVTAGSVTSTSLGAEFVINEQGDAPTLESDFYIFFGYVEFKMRAANGTGIVSTVLLESDDLDEIDWEQVSTFDTEIQTNYFGKGNTTSYDRATTVTVASPEETFHTYAINWTAATTQWLIDGAVVRTLNYADALDGENYPQTPMRIRLGIWAGGDPDNSEGTIEWAGGETDYSAAPFKMYVESVSVINYNPADEYTYSDKTGSWESIKASNTTSSSSLKTSSKTSSKAVSNSSVATSAAVSSSASVLATASSSAAAVYKGGAAASATPLFMGVLAAVVSGMLYI
ncbi:concanavalin A-like lectin/glucanase domain-containing protein [Aspergillus floccosus]